MFRLDFFTGATERWRSEAALRARRVRVDNPEDPLGYVEKRIGLSLAPSSGAAGSTSKSFWHVSLMVEAGRGRKARFQGVSAAMYLAKIAAGGAMLLLALTACISILLLARSLEVACRRSL